MRYEEVYAFLETIGSPGVRDEGDWVMTHCPLAPYVDEHKGSFDSTPSCGVHVDDNGMSFYNCFTCKNKGPVSDLAKYLGRMRDEPELVTLGRQIEEGAALMGAESAFQDWDEDDETYSTAKQEATIPEGRYHEGQAFKEYPSVLTEHRALRYLRRRGISLTTAIALRLRYDPKQYRILFPVYYDAWRNGRRHSFLVGFSGRTIRNKRYIEYRNSVRKGSYPKIRDYKGLDKENVILARRTGVSASCITTGVVERVCGGGAARDGRNPHGPRGTAAGSGASQKGTARRPSFLIVVEGLFGEAHLQTIAPDLDHCALLGSVVTPGKVQRLLEREQALYWLTDNDEAGHACLWGNKDKKTGKRNIRKGALYQIGHRTPQFIMPWPKLAEPVQRRDGTWKTHKEDPDELTREDLDWSIANAQVYVHRGR